MMIAAASEAKNIMGSGEVKRAITGDWVDQFYGGHRNRRGDVDGEKGFRYIIITIVCRICRVEPVFNR